MSEIREICENMDLLTLMKAARASKLMFPNVAHEIEDALNDRLDRLSYYELEVAMWQVGATLGGGAGDVKNNMNERRMNG